MALKAAYQTTIWGWLVQQLLDPAHELLVLAAQIDWDAITEALRPYYKLRGRYAKPVRLMVGLHLLKHRYGLSDEGVVQGLHENLYWMVFCGIDLGEVLEQGQPGEPLHWVEASTLCKWRKRLGVQDTQVLEGVIHQQLVYDKVLSPRTMLTDTTAMEKHVVYPTDTALLDKGRRQLVGLIRQAQGLGVTVSRSFRSFSRTAKRVVLEVAKFGKDKIERIEAANGELSAMAQQVLRRVPEVVGQLGEQFAALAQAGQPQAAQARARLRDQVVAMAELVHRVIEQNAERFQGRHVPNKVLSLHEPQVVSIRKGKCGKATEYGSKVSLSIDRGGFVVTHQEYASNIADPETLPAALAGWVEVFGRLPPELGADRGLHHAARDQERLGTAQVARVSIPRKGKQRHPDAETAWFKRLQRLRSHIEPVIGHLKADHSMDQCRYKGFEGDQINVSWAVLAWNTKKWGRLLQHRHRAAGSLAQPVAP